ncbi:hypothetical protein L596_017961 [Steinernema carpocapsae]|uniref:DNA polymerase V n=1 Tax=Steinernema carpocapsae TaxID=34508 RepID=A0A4U5N381_STECR|nr:hypothetical protein L596_017961 [Steinernema carpocapsae]
MTSVQVYSIFKKLKDLVHDSWKVKEVGSVFAALQVAKQQKALEKMLALCEAAEDDTVPIAIGNSIASVLKTEARPGKKAHTDVSQATRVMLWNVFRAADESVEEKEDPTVFEVLYACLSILAKAWKGPTALQYQSDAEEAAVFTEGHKNGDLDHAIVVDLLMSLLSRHHKYHKALVYYVFIEMIPEMQVDHLKHILETISMPDEEMMKNADDEDDELEEIDEDMEAEDEEAEDEEAKEEESEDEDEEMEVDEDDDDAPIDPKLLANLKEALGDAVDKDDESDEESSDELDDEAMLKMDDMLANAFREHFAKTRKSQKENLEHIRQFRMKCFDLIVLVLSHEKGRSMAPDLIEPFVALTKETLKRPNSESVFKRAKDVLDMISNMRKLVISEKQVLKSLEHLNEVSVGMTNPAMKEMVAGLSQLLFSASFDSEGKPPAAVKKFYEKLLDAYMKDDKVLSELATAPYLKYPTVLVSFAPKLVEYAYDSNVKVFKRTEALTCLQVFMRKDLITSKDAATKKIFAKVAKLLAPRFSAFIKECSSEEMKPRLFAFALKTFVTFAKNASKEQLAELRTVAPVVEEFTEVKDLKERLKTAHKAVHAVCGKKPFTIIQEIYTLVEE